MVNSRLSISFLKSRTLPLALLIISALLVLALTQDWLHAKVQGYNFYLSESLLFNSFWLCFVPVALLVKRLQLKSSILSILVRSIASTSLHFLLYALIVFGLSSLLFEQDYSFSGVLTYASSGYLYIALIGYPLIYSAFNLINRPNPATVMPSTEMITVTQGAQRVLVNPTDIISIQAESPYIKLITSKCSFLHSASLKSIHEKLDHGDFLRIHKSTIINVNMIVSYKSRLNGDYDIELNNGSTVRMSRNYSAALKNRLK